MAKWVRRNNGYFKLDKKGRTIGFSKYQPDEMIGNTNNK